MILLSFCFFLLLFVLVGVASIIQNKHTTEDYLIADREVKPWLAALSAVATNNSGYMFIGMIGFTYVVGLASVWLLVGWIVGDFISSTFIHKYLRTQTEQKKAVSYASLISRISDDNQVWVRVIGGVITVLFLGIYAAAQLKAGSKALHVLFGWDYSVGAIVGAFIVLLYCFAGGIRASIWTDAAQSFVMVLAMGCLFFICLYSLGGLHAFGQALVNVSPTYTNLFPEGTIFGPTLGAILFVTGWLFAGIGVIGQPHIMIRFMAVDDVKNINRTRLYYYIWYAIFYALTFGVGLMTRIFMPESGFFDEELALPMLAQMTLPDVFVGLILAGLFAATMSTADSQILSCTASFSEDFNLNQSHHYWFTKSITLVITVSALLIALYGHDSVFQLVLIAWSALASSFAPILIVCALGGKPKEITAVLMMISGLLAMIIWRKAGLGDDVYEIMPGIIAGFVPYLFQLLIACIKKQFLNQGKTI